jgi:hypothetical protein
MSDAGERYVRWYARLPADAPLDLHAARALLRRALADQNAMAEYLLEHECAPALPGEFIFRHWNDAISDAPSRAAFRLALVVIRALERIVDERDWMATLDMFQRGIIPTARMLRQLCREINDAR